MIKKIILAILLFALLFTNIVPVYSLEMETATVIEVSYLNNADVQADVVQFIAGTAQNNTECPWNESTIISETISMVDFDGNINAYIFNLTTDGKPSGYIFYDAISDSPGVQEYGYDGQYYLSNMEQFKNREAEDQIIYAGGRSFLLQKNSRFYDMNTNQRVTLTKQSMSRAYKQNIAEVRQVKAQQLMQQSSAETKAAVSYPSAWTILNLWVPNAWQPEQMQDYATIAGSGNCAPTSVLNYLKYFYQRRNRNMLIVSNYTATYEFLMDYVPVKENGLDTILVYAGFIQYCEKINKPALGRDYVSYGSTYFNYEWFQRNLYNNHMLIMGVRTSAYKPDQSDGGHALNAVGYEYNASNSTDYIRVADQWDHSLSHFYRFNGGVDIYGAFYLRWE